MISTATASGAAVGAADQTAIAAAASKTAAPTIPSTEIQRIQQTNESIFKEFDELQEKLPQYVQATTDLKAYVEKRAAGGGNTAVAAALAGESPATKSKRKRKAAAAPPPSDRVTRSRSPKKAKR